MRANTTDSCPLFEAYALCRGGRGYESATDMKGMVDQPSEGSLLSAWINRRERWSTAAARYGTQILAIETLLKR